MFPGKASDAENLKSKKKTRRYGTVSAAFCGTLALVFSILFARTPSFQKVTELALGSDRVLLAADGQVVQTLRTDFSKRRLAWHPLASFTEELRVAVIGAEDRRFFSHPGVDFLGLGRAILALFSQESVQGASTISMQLGDLIQPEVLTENRSIPKGSVLHKISQMSRALALEIRWNKAQILEAYLNLIHLRGEFQGVPAVTEAYFKKKTLALDAAEAAVVATMISSPNQGQVALKRRTCLLVKRLAIHNAAFAAAADCSTTDLAVETLIRAHPTLPTQLGSSPHLARRLFKTHRDATILQSTINAQLQNEVQAILEKNLAALRNSNVNDSAAIVIENRTGKVLAYVGAVTSSSSPHVDGVEAYRQAGSTLKPFLYGKALDLKLLTAASILNDEPTAISWEGNIYRPTNYDRQFYGTVSIREALASSLNVPAVKIVTIVGLQRSYQVLKTLRLTNLKDQDFYGVSMALGAVDVRLDELTNAYRMLANSGEWSPLIFKENEVQAPSEHLFSRETAFILSSILSDADARALGFGWDSPLETPFWTAVKTGTSKDYRDNWCIGFSEHYTVGVWTGNFNAEAMDKVSGVSGAGPSWFAIMERLHRSKQSHSPPVSENIVTKEIRHAWATHQHKEFFIRGTEPETNVMEPALEKNAQFVFPADGSTLVRDPHIDPAHIALFVRFKGKVPNNSRIFFDGLEKGEAVSPFKLTDFSVGPHELSIRAPDGQIAARAKFSVRGAN
jgi:penicillin-binding protein 1C